MGFERPEYLRGKELTHPRMATLETLCTVQASEFDRSPDGFKAEGRKVTQAIRQALRDRWSEWRRRADASGSPGARLSGTLEKRR